MSRAAAIGILLASLAPSPWADPGRDDPRSALAVSSAPEARTASSPAAEPLRLAAAKLIAGDYPAARTAALDAVRADPANPLGYLRAAEADNKLGDYAEAESMARAAGERDPKSAQARRNLAWALLKQGKYEPSLAAALEAARLKPDLAEALAVAAYDFEKLGQTTARDNYLRQAAAADPRYQTKLDAALNGRKVYDDGAGLEPEIRGAADAPTRAPWIALGVLVVCAALMAGVALSRPRLEPVPPTPAARAAGAERSSDPNLIGQYRLTGVIGRGGMGEVYLAADTKLGRQVAIKRLAGKMAAAGPESREALLHEARTVAQLQHSAIVEIYDVVESPDDLFLVFELLHGTTLHSILAQSGRIAVRRAAEILRPVCEALDYAHARSIVHRDVKPANIMLTDQGFVKLMDFGAARTIGSTTRAAAGHVPDPFGRTIHAIGTPAYMAPESELGLIYREGDVFSLGATLHEMLTGQPPFGPMMGSRDKTLGRFSAASALTPGLPPAVDAVIARSLKAAPQERFRSAGELLAALEAALTPDG